MKTMFFSGACFNWAIAALFIVAPNDTLSLMGIDPPDNPVWLHFFAVLVAGFGLSYYFISRHPQRNTDLIWSGAITKISVVVVGVVHVALGNIFWTILVPVSVDLIYTILFIRSALILIKI